MRVDVGIPQVTKGGRSTSDPDGAGPTLAIRSHRPGDAAQRMGQVPVSSEGDQEPGISAQPGQSTFSTPMIDAVPGFVSAM